MASFNRVILIGNLTRDPELRYTRSGLAVMDVGLAVNDRRKNQSGEWVDETTFVDVTLWGRTAEIAGEYLSKGSLVFFEGRLKLDRMVSARLPLDAINEAFELMRQGSGARTVIEMSRAAVGQEAA